MRQAAFWALAESGKLHGGLLEESAVYAMYELIRSEEADPQLREAAARAFGSLNLPSHQVKDLILDQAKS